MNVLSVISINIITKRGWKKSQDLKIAGNHVTKNGLE